MVRLGQSRHGAGHAGGERAGEAPIGRLTLGIEVHVAAGARGSRFAVVECLHGPIPRPDHHESAAAKVARLRVNHGEREPHRHGGVHRVSPCPEDLPANLAGERASRDHHRRPALGHPGLPGKAPRGPETRLRPAFGAMGTRE